MQESEENRTRSKEKRKYERQSPRNTAKQKPNLVVVPPQFGLNFLPSSPNSLHLFHQSTSSTIFLTLSFTSSCLILGST